MRSFRVSSRVAADPAAVWEAVSTIRGVNRELWPVARMTVPGGRAGRSGGGVLRVGSLGRSWILLGGVLPVDYDDLRLEALEPERGFRERSALGSARAWHHDRSLEPVAGGSLVVDRIAFEPRVAALGGLQAFVFEATFRWRHRRLQRMFGRAAG